MKLRCFSVFLLTLVFLEGQAQLENKDLLFTVEDDSIYSSDFIRVYYKNLELVLDESQKDVDEYLNMFINYRLKIKEAKTLGLDKKTTYLKELATHKKQLAQSFLVDNQVTEALVNEAYDRILNEVHVSHILVKLEPTASARDTIAAYNAIMKFRERAFKEGFETVRKDVHNGQTIFGEDLGYFTAFKMVYPFENIAYSTNVGDVSQPFKTQYGYHMVLVKDKRKSKGERSVAHIMLRESIGDSVANNSEKRIHDIYKKLNQGGNFESLAKQFSEDKNSAVKGGLLSPFVAGQLSSQEFEDVAFSLENIGDVSKPFRSDFGWHIVKLYGKKPVESFENLKSQLESQVKRDDRSKIIDKALYDKLRSRYNVSYSQPVLNYFANLLNEDYFKGSWELPQDFNGDKPLVKIVDRQLHFNEFGDYLVKSQPQSTGKVDYLEVVTKAYDSFLNANLLQYQEDNLDRENENFASVMNEYKDGLLLFDLMEHAIWKTSPSDSIAIRNLYENQKERYFFPQRVDAIVASSAKQNVIKRVSKLLASGMGVEGIEKLLNSNGKVEVFFTSDFLDVNHRALPKDFNFKVGVSKVYKHHDTFVVVKVNNVLPKRIKSFQEATGEVVLDYQTVKETKWLEELKKKYNVDVNQVSLNKVKSQIKNQ